MTSTAYFDNIKDVIKKELYAADRCIFIAVAWFSDKDLFRVLIEKCSNGVFIKLIYYDDPNTESNLDFTQLERKGAKIYPVNDSLMHNKFCIIDFKTVITGSYNWTYSANSFNLENIIVSNGDDTLVTKFVDNFNDIIRKHFGEGPMEERNPELIIRNTVTSYKFQNKYYLSFPEISLQLISSTVAFDDSVLHFQKGYLERWLQDINDFDSLVQMDKARDSGLDSEEIIYSLVCYANPGIDFTLYNVRLYYDNLYDYLLEYSNGTEDKTLIRISECMMSGKLGQFAKIYSAFNPATKNHFLQHVQWLSNQGDKATIEGHLKVLHYFAYPNDYIYRGKFFYSQIDSIFSSTKFDQLDSEYVIVNELRESLYSNDFDRYFPAVDELLGLKERATLQKIVPEEFLSQLCHLGMRQYRIVERYGHIIFSEKYYLPESVLRIIFSKEPYEDSLQSVEEFLRSLSDDRYSKSHYNISLQNLVNILGGSDSDSKDILQYQAISNYLNKNCGHIAGSLIQKTEIIRAFDLVQNAESNCHQEFQSYRQELSLPDYDPKDLSVLEYMHIISVVEEMISLPISEQILPLEIKEQLCSQSFALIKKAIHFVEKNCKGIVITTKSIEELYLPKTLLSGFDNVSMSNFPGTMTAYSRLKEFLIPKKALNSIALPDIAYEYLDDSDISQYMFFSRIFYLKSLLRFSKPNSNDCDEYYYDSIIYYLKSLFPLSKPNCNDCDQYHHDSVIGVEEFDYQQFLLWYKRQSALLSQNDYDVELSKGFKSFRGVLKVVWTSKLKKGGKGGHKIAQLVSNTDDRTIHNVPAFLFIKFSLEYPGQNLVLFNKEGDWKISPAITWSYDVETGISL